MLKLLLQVGRSFLRDPDWLYCDFTCYINWLVQYVQVRDYWIR